MTKKATTPTAGAAKKKGKLAPVLLIVGTLLAATGGAAGAYFFFGQPRSDASEAKSDSGRVPTKQVEKRTPVFVPLEPFTVNLQDDDAGHYLQVGIVLEVTGSDAVDAIKVHMPVIRNRVLLLLSSKRSADIASLAGKQKLAEEIVAESRAPLPLPEPVRGVQGVYFSSFVIQ